MKCFVYFSGQLYVFNHFYIYMQFVKKPKIVLLDNWIGKQARKEISTSNIQNADVNSSGCVFSTVMSVNMEDSCTGTTSEDDPETQSTGSLSSTSAPLDLACPFPSSCSPYPMLSSSCPYPSPSAAPELLQLPGSGSLEGFEQVSPVLGPRSECSGASSPDCEQERGESQKRLNHED